jgi:hypothetical protein
MQNKVKFKCNLTGNVFEFSNTFDIEDMREHPQYTEVEEQEEIVQKKVAPKKKAKGDVN